MAVYVEHTRTKMHTEFTHSNRPTGMHAIMRHILKVQDDFCEQAQASESNTFTTEFSH